MEALSPHRPRYPRAMKIGFVVAADRYTGAAAVAELMCRAVRAAGLEGELLFVGGRNLDHRLKEVDWAHADLARERSPASFGHNLRRIRQLARNHDAVVSHLPHDHSLCVAAGVRRYSLLVRNFRNLKHLTSNPWQRWLNRTIAGRLVANSGMLDPSSDRPSLALPVPVEDRFHRGAKPGPWREWLGIPDDAPVLGIVGKVAPGRGFSLALESTRLVDRRVHLLAVGHGEALGDLQRSAVEMGLEGRVHWLGYRGGDLPELYRTMDLVLFPAAGSDHGHRAITEAQACERPVIAASLEGVGDLIKNGVTGRIVGPTPSAFAGAIGELLDNRNRARDIGRAAALAVENRRMVVVGGRLVDFLNSLISR